MYDSASLIVYFLVQKKTQQMIKNFSTRKTKWANNNTIIFGCIWFRLKLERILAKRHWRLLSQIAGRGLHGLSQPAEWDCGSDGLSLQFFPFINQHFLDRLWQRFVFSLWQPETKESPGKTQRPEYKELKATGCLSEHHHERCEDGANPRNGADYSQGGVPDAGGEYLTWDDVDSFKGAGNAELGCN